MTELIYPRERTLGLITLILGILVWIGLIIGTVGIILIALGLSFLIYLFAQSALISYIKGNGIELSETQFPDLYTQFKACCTRLEFDEIPSIYILNGDGGMNAFATKFLRKPYVVLLSDVVDAMAEHQDGVSFYMGHELGHLRMNHLGFGVLLRWPVLWLPLLGAAYSRARESTCDRHGRACCANNEGAVRALAALAAGSQRWKDLRIADYVKQTRHTAGFWMSFHELVAPYPWLSKRAARLVNPDIRLPARNVFSYFFAVFVPYAGRLGAGFGFLIVIYVVGVLAAIALPAYQDYTTKAKLSLAMQQSDQTRTALAKHFMATKQVPASLAEIKQANRLSDDMEMELDPQSMILKVGNAKMYLLFIPQVGDQGQIRWTCEGGQGLRAGQLPRGCNAVEQQAIE